jgi:hypothetical protein
MKHTCYQKNKKEVEQSQFRSTFMVIMAIGISLAVLTSSKPRKSHPLIGKWTPSVALVNGNVDPGARTNRVQEYRDDNTYDARFIDVNGKANIDYMGKFYFVNDTTIVSLRCDITGRPSNLSNVYTVKVSNDTLHLYGYAIKALPSGGVTSFFLNEYWVRTDKEIKIK